MSETHPRPWAYVHVGACLPPSYRAGYLVDVAFALVGNHAIMFMYTLSVARAGAHPLCQLIAEQALRPNQACHVKRLWYLRTSWSLVQLVNGFAIGLVGDELGHFFVFLPLPCSFPTIPASIIL